MKLNTFLLSGLVISLLWSTGWAEMGKAVISGTKDPTSVSGVVMLQDTPGGLQIDAQISKAPPGDHAFHIHEFGACEDEGKAAGSHYNPSGHPHGNTLTTGISKVHAGDFGNLTIAANGTGMLKALVPGLTLSQGKYPIAGRAFVLHEKADDYSQPVGNAGSRIGCGPIIITGK